MKKTSLIFSLLFLSVVLFGCQQNSEGAQDTEEIRGSEAEIQEIPHSKEQITVSIEKKEFPISIDQIEVFFKNDSDIYFLYSLLPSIEKFIEGTWFELPYQSDITIEASENGIYGKTDKTESFSLEILSDELSSGKYRIVNKFYREEEGSNTEPVTVAAEFELVE